MDARPVNLESVVVSVPGGASYDPAASILDDARAAARCPWPYNIRPKEFLIGSGRHIPVPVTDIPAPIDALSKQVQPGLWDALTVVPAARPCVEPELGLLRYGGDDEDVLSLDEVLATDGAAAEDDEPTPRGMRPPADKRTRKKYYALRTRAAKARATHPQQARALDAQADALMEPVVDEAPSRARASSTRPDGRRQQDVVAARDIDPIWLDLQVYQITKWSSGTPHQRQRAAALLDMMLPIFAAANVPPPTIAPAPAPIDLSAFRAAPLSNEDTHEYGTSTDWHLDRAA